MNGMDALSSRGFFESTHVLIGASHFLFTCRWAPLIQRVVSEREPEDVSVVA